ncbi:MAG: 4Fe-4S dicluster domain-containing protein [Bacteroidota bacterium]
MATGDSRAEIAQRLRDIARDLLERGEVDVFIGYEEGSLPLRTTPAFISRPDDVSRLVWNRACENNLAAYLPKFKGRVGVVVKGCDVRTLVNLIVEKQISRDQVKIVGVPCRGVIDRRRLAAAVGEGSAVRSAVQPAVDVVVVRGEGFEKAVPVEDVLSPACATCTHPVPVIHDFLAGEDGWAREACPRETGFAHVEEFADRSAEERFAYFAREIERCIECYACRQACPLCYCPECFVDRQIPKWVGRWRDLSDKMVFHLGRVLHTAGRCVDCGACRRACPAGIDLRLLAKRMEKDALEFFGHEPGIDLQAVPVLATYRREDPDDFIL